MQKNKENLNFFAGICGFGWDSWF